MSDRELLELSARAAGLVPLVLVSPGSLWYEKDADASEAFYWNPLTDDGDALRLAVKLQILVLTARGFAVANSSDSGGTVECLLSDPDPYAATRRAIVRAAAAIGEQMP